MQERYLGDWHDFLKYALLRFLGNNLELRIGINWYLTRPEELGEIGNNDGEKRHHLKGGEWEEWDSDLFRRIRHFENPIERCLDRIATSGILPSDTIYFEEPVLMKKRDFWHQSALLKLADADLVFLDPDNGFEVSSMKPQNSLKYSFFQEAVDFLLMGKVVVGIQFARQCDPIERGIKRRDQLQTLVGSGAMLPIIRGRVSPNILFLTLSPPAQVEQVRKTLFDFADRSPKFAKDKYRVEIIN